MKKEVQQKLSGDNSFGVASVVLGILALTLLPFNGLVLSIVSLIFANKQNKISKNKWSKAGKILSIIAIVLSVLIIIGIAIGIKSDPNFLNNLGAY